MSSSFTLFSIENEHNPIIKRQENEQSGLPKLKLLAFPKEIVEDIFVFCSNAAQLYKTCRLLHDFSLSEDIKAKWLLTHYGAKDAFSQCWKYKFMHQTRLGRRPCKCRHFQKSDPCPIEFRQISLLHHIMTRCKSLEELSQSDCLSMATSMGHVKLVAFLLQSGCDPNREFERHNRFKELLDRFGMRKLLFSFAAASPIQENSSVHTLNSSSAESLPETNFELPNYILGDDAVHLNQEPSSVDPHAQYTNCLLLKAVKEKKTNMVYALLLSTQLSCQAHHDFPLVTGPSNQSWVPLNEEIISAAFSLALLSHHDKIAQLLYNTKLAKTAIRTVHTLILKANMRRILTGNRSKFTKVLSLAIQALPEHDFTRYSTLLMRNCAEIGDVGALKSVMERGGDVNTWDGLPLYTAMYCGNYEVTLFLISEEANASLDYIGFRQLAFCTGLLFMEAVAFTLFLGLISLWLVGFLDYTKTNRLIDITEPFVDLTTMTVPTALALVLMYRLVPFHRVLRCLLKIVVEKRKRRTGRSNV